MADNYAKRVSFSQSQSTQNDKNSKVHIPVMDFEEYKIEQANNMPSSKDDMFLTFSERMSCKKKNICARIHNKQILQKQNI